MEGRGEGRGREGGSLIDAEAEVWTKGVKSSRWVVMGHMEWRPTGCQLMLGSQVGNKTFSFFDFFFPVLYRSVFTHTSVFRNFEVPGFPSRGRPVSVYAYGHTYVEIFIRYGHTVYTAIARTGGCVPY